MIISSQSVCDNPFRISAFVTGTEGNFPVVQVTKYIHTILRTFFGKQNCVRISNLYPSIHHSAKKQPGALTKPEQCGKRLDPLVRIGSLFSLHHMVCPPVANYQFWHTLRGAKQRGGSTRKMEFLQISLSGSFYMA